MSSAADRTLHHLRRAIEAAQGEVAPGELTLESVLPMLQSAVGHLRYLMELHDGNLTEGGGQ